VVLQDARSFMLSFQYWLGGSPENLESMLLMMANNYIYEGQSTIDAAKIVDPILLPDLGIWHPMAPRVFEDSAEYNAWYDSEHAPLVGINPRNAPTVGVILQKSHINTKDECHYTSLIQELEARGARVICVYSGGLDFSVPLEMYFTKGSVVPDSVINLTGFALVGGHLNDGVKLRELSVFGRQHACGQCECVAFEAELGCVINSL
jgi:magnesium chelatase subunit H